MKKIVLGSLITAASLLAASFTACAGCHGQKGEKRALGKSQIIQGWSADKIATALKGYKDGTYGGPMKGVMKSQVTRLSELDIQTLAATISKF